MIKHLICTKTDQRIILKELIASSGEGEVWRTENPAILAKIYHSPTLQRQEKLKVMVKYPPQDPNQHRRCISFAWPESLLADRSGMIVGFLMPAINGAKELIEVYNPSRRKKNSLTVDWYFLHTAAHNIASIIHAIHEANYVLGDIKPQNILINNQAIPSIIDTDSFQVTNPRNGQIYRCLVGSEGFTPPELLGKDFALLNQTEVQDRFRLGVIIYYLLFGSHPFQGKWIGTGDALELSDLIRQGYWVFGHQSLIKPSRLTIALSTVHPALKDCFIQCFSKGYDNPRSRPTAKEWQDSLRLAINSLTICNQAQNHYYHQDNATCYWCERAIKLKTDIFGKALRPSVPNTSVPLFPQLGKSVASILFPSQPQVVRMSYGQSNYQVLTHRQAFLRRKFNRNTFLIVGNLSLLGSILISVFLFQEFPTPSHSIVSYRLPVQEAKIVPSQSASVYNQRGYIRYAQGDDLGAIADFNQAIKLNPQLAEAYYNRSLAKSNLGYEQAAKQDWNQAMLLDPQLAANYHSPLLPDTEENTDSNPVAALRPMPTDSIDMAEPVENFSDLNLNASRPSANQPTPKPSNFPQDEMSFLFENTDLKIPEDLPKPTVSVLTKPASPTKIGNKSSKESRNRAQILANKIEAYSAKKMKTEDIDYQDINVNLALSFYQQGIFYKNLGINSEALRNLEEASLLLQKDGNKDIAKEVETMIRNLKKTK